jgi:hypothetical protein
VLQRVRLGRAGQHLARPRLASSKA